jgi:hypothetical protein
MIFYSKFLGESMHNATTSVLIITIESVKAIIKKQLKQNSTVVEKEEVFSHVISLIPCPPDLEGKKKNSKTKTKKLKKNSMNATLKTLIV